MNEPLYKQFLSSNKPGPTGERRQGVSKMALELMADGEVHTRSEIRGFTDSTNTQTNGILKNLINTGKIEKVGRGLYRLKK